MTCGLLRARVSRRRHDGGDGEKRAGDDPDGGGRRRRLVAAVSKVLREAYGVSDALRARVAGVDAAARLSAARGGARHARADLHPRLAPVPDIHNPFFADIMAGVNAALERRNTRRCSAWASRPSRIEKALIEAMIDRQMDGIIMIGPRMPATELVAIAERIPDVADRASTRRRSPNFDTVNNDDVEGAKLVVRHLVDGGYRNIAYLSLRPAARTRWLAVTAQREIGYREAMEEAGMTRQIKVVLRRTDAARRPARRAPLLTSRGRPDAIFCWTDFIALEVLSVARELGLSVPGDLAVVGYDNTTYCDLAQNALTSIDQSGQVLGLQAARLLIERIKGRTAAEHFVVTPRLVARASSRPK